MQACDAGLRRDAGVRERRVASVIDAVREASSTVDAMWLDAVSGDDADRLVGLGDASHGLHMALVALEDGEADRRARVP